MNRDGTRPDRSAWIFIVLVLGLSYGMMLPFLFRTGGREVVAAMQLPLALTPVFSVLLLNYFFPERGYLQAIAARWMDWKLGVGWYLLALALFPALAGLAFGLRYLWDGQWPHFEPPSLQTYAVLPMILLFPGFAEENGWRGFLQPQLQRRCGPWVASLIVGLTWGIWHARDGWIRPERFPGYTLGAFFGMTVAAGLLLGWIWQFTRGSLWIATVAHFSANLVFQCMPVVPASGDFTTAWIYLGCLWSGGLLLFGCVRPRPAQRHSDAGEV